MPTWDWAWIEAKYKTGSTCRVVAQLYRSKFGNGPSHSTISRYAKAKRWAQDKKGIVTKRMELAATSQEITNTQFEEALKGLVVHARQKRDLDKAQGFIRILFEQLETYRNKLIGTYGGLEMQEIRTMAAITKTLASAMKDLTGLECSVYGLQKPEKPGNGVEATEQLNKEAIAVAASFLNRCDGLDEEPLEEIVGSVQAVHLSRIPASVVSSSGSEELGNLDDCDDEKADSPYTTETW